MKIFGIMFNNEICNLVYVHDLKEISHRKTESKVKSKDGIQNANFSIRKLFSDSFKIIA